MIGSLLLFTSCWILAFWLAKYGAKKTASLEKNGSVSEVNTNKMPLWCIILMASFCTFYNYYVTTTGDGYGADRNNYLTSFDYGRFESEGLMFLIALVQKYGGEFNDLLYISTFISVFFVMLAYKYSRDARPEALMLFFMSPYVFQTFTALKQCYTTAFATLFIMLLMQKKTFIKECICISLIVVACLFHSAGYLLLILYILIRVNFKIDNLPKVLFFALIILLFFKPIMLFVASLTSSVFPYLTNKIYEYFGEEGMEAERGIIVVLKGLPYFYITYWAIKYKNLLRDKIQDYYKYVLISFVGSVFYLATIYNVWMRRATDLLTFAIIVFWYQILIYVPASKDKRIMEIVLMCLFTYRWLIMIYINFGTF